MTPPRAILEWPRGFGAKPIIMAITNTREEYEEILRILERALAATYDDN